MSDASAGPLGRIGRRLEDAPLLTGAGRFTADLAFEGVLHAAFVRSHEASGDITSIDVSQAAAVPGVVGVFTSSDLGDLRLMPPDFLGQPDMSYPVLAGARVRFAGQAVVMVVADHPARAADGAEAVFVEIDPRSPVVDALEAASDETLVFEAAGTNVVVDRRLGEPVSDSELSYEKLEVTSRRIDPMTLETFAAIAVPEPDGVSLWCPSGTPLITRDVVAAAAGIDPESLVVRVPDVGGAFGQRGGARPEYVALTAAAMRLGRPVRWVATRREQLSAGDHGRDSEHRVTVGFTADGRIRSLDIDVVVNLGAFPHRGWFIPLTALQNAPGPYAIDSISVHARGVVTNTSPTGPYRGAGRPEAGLAIEEAVAAVARATGLTSDQVRERNFVPPEAMPLTTETGLTHDGGHYEEIIRTSRELTEGLARRHRDRAAGRLVGAGVASFIETTAGSHVTGEYGRVEVRPSGVFAFTGSVSSGQGHRTVWPAIVSEVLRVPHEQVIVISGDTSRIPAGTGTFGSRSAALGAVALSRVASEVRGMVLDRAAAMLEVSVDDLVLGAEGVSVRGVPDSVVSLAGIAEAAEAAGVQLVADETFISEDQPLASGCYGAVVSVDPDTGDVTLLELIAVDDCGVQLHPMIVKGQVHGGIAQGVGQAMFERLVYDSAGQPLTTTLMDYLIPAAGDLPSFTLDGRATPSPFNHFGVKGVGEAGTIGAPPAIVAAVRDAIGAATRETDLRLPLHAERVWRSLT